MASDRETLPMADALRARAEALAAARDDAHDPRVGDEPGALLHEMRIHQIELEVQNEALRQSQLELEASKTRYQELFDRAPIGYCELNAQGLIVEANRMAASLFGIAQAALPGLPFTQLIDPDDQDLFYLRRIAAFNSAQTQVLELKLNRADLPRFPASLQINVERQPDATQLLRITISDITARERLAAELRVASEELEFRVVERTAELGFTEDGLRAEIALRALSEERLRHSEGQLRTLLDAAGAAIVTTDRNGIIELFNRKAESTFGWAASEILGRSMSLLVPPPHRNAHDGYIARYVQSGKHLPSGRRLEVEGSRKNGEIFPLEIIVSEFEEANVRRFTAIMRDLTEQRQLEAQFRQAQKMEAIARLSTGIAHDFNNLLMGVLGCCAAAQQHLSANHEAATHLADIKGAAERGATLTRQLLSHARMPAAPLGPMALHPVVRTVARILQNVLGEDIALSVILAATDDTIWGDPSSLEQVLMNLAVNARDAMKEGGKLRISTQEVDLTEVKASPSGALPAGRYVQLEVEDTGSGISPDVQQHLFEPFFTTKPAGEGTGLGLYAVYRTVDRMGGGVDVTSEPGSGARFTLLLPRQVHDTASTVPVPATTSQTNPVPAPQARRTLLVVEDESLIRFTIQNMLAHQPFEILMADSFDDAKRVVAQHAGEIDVLLTDIVLPGGTGGALAEWLRRERPNLQIVFMSAYPTAVLVERGSIPPGAMSLEKPFSEEQLRRALGTA